MVSFISNIIQTTVGFLLNPVETFQQHDDTSFEQALQYFGALIVFNIALSIIIIIVATLTGDGTPGVFVFISITFFAIIAFIRVVIGLVIMGLFQHIFVLLMGGEQGIVQTLKAIMYSSVPGLIFGWIASIFSAFQTMGTILLIIICITTIWALVLLVLGIRELHYISTARAIGAVLIPVAIVVLIGLLLIGYIVSLFNLSVF